MAVPRPTNDLNGLIQLVTDTLAADDAVRDAVSGRIRSAHVQAPDEGTVECPALVVEWADGGDGHYAGSLQRMAFAVEAFSQVSSTDALAIYGLAYTALQMEQLTAPTDGPTQRGQAREVRRPYVSWDETRRAWSARGNWFAISAGG